MVAARTTGGWAWLVLWCFSCLSCDNGNSVPPEPVRFSHEPGTFLGPLELSASPLPDGVTAHYTLDGSLPNGTSPVWSAPFVVDQSTLVRAVAVRDGPPNEKNRSKVVSGHFLRATPDTTGFSSSLPLAVIHMLGNQEPSPDRYDFQRAGLQLFEPNAGRTVLLGQAAVDSRIGIKVRGSSTRLDRKHSFSIELWDEIDKKDHPRSLLGMPAHADWVLYAPYYWDQFGLRNALMYELSNELGDYASRTRFIELFLVEGDRELRASDYRGLYLLTERLERGARRIPVEALSPGDRTMPEVTGGYIVKAESPSPCERGFRVAELALCYVYPKEREISARQREYIVGYFEQVARAAAAVDGVDPKSGLHYSALIDVDSFIDHHILNLFAKNPDGLRRSAYFHKRRGGPLRAGPVWDFDRTLGSNDDRDDDPTGWNASRDGTRMFQHGLWGDLFLHAEFRNAYADRLRAVLSGPLSAKKVHTRIERYAYLRDSAQRDGVRWPRREPSSGDFRADLTNLKRWTAARIAWLIDNVDQLRP